MRNTLVETLIGAVVLVVAAVFLWFAYSTAGLTARSGYDLVARFDRADGISAGTDVRVAGVKVGSVERVIVDPKSFDAIVTVRIDERYTLPDDTIARISMSGLLGDNFISLQPGGSETNLAAGDEFFQAYGSVDLIGLVSEAIFGARGGEKVPDGNNLNQN